MDHLLEQAQVNQVFNQQISDTKENCPEATISPVRKITLNSQQALTYDVKQCLGDYTSIAVSNGAQTFLITELYPGDNQNHDYRKTLDQILSTFEFLN